MLFSSFHVLSIENFSISPAYYTPPPQKKKKKNPGFHDLVHKRCNPFRACQNLGTSQEQVIHIGFIGECI